VPLEPAPISPVGDRAWNVLEGTIHAVLGNGVAGKNGSELIVTPMVMPANTDTRSYWNLTRNIYRFNPVEKMEGYHTVNERLGLNSYINAIKFYHELIRNYDEDTA
ncbi:hypothetical protein HK101_007083, partial [Irineochytrium annulatum]